MTGCDPTAGDGLFKRLRNVRESDLQGPGRFGGRLVPELADRAVLVRRVVLVADGLDGRGTGQHQRQEDDPGAPTGTTCCEPRVHGISPGHKLLKLAENHPGWQGARPDGRALTPARLCFFNRGMASSKRMTAMGAAVFVVLALASVGVALHEHDADVQSAAHADCDACHIRHVSVVETDGTPGPAAPALVVLGVVSTDPDGERAAALGILATRGPPA